MAERNRSEPFIEDADRFPEDGTRTRRPPSPDQETRRRKTQQRRRRNSVFQYIAVLFMAAFVLLLFTFMMERRQSQQQIDDLKQSASTVQTLQGLMKENDELKARVQELEKEVELHKQAAQSFETSLDGLTDAHAHLENVHEWTIEAMTWFWELSDSSVRGRLNQCRAIIAIMESPETNPAAGPLVDYLPKENVTGTDHLSPADRYADIRNRVIY